MTTALCHYFLSAPFASCFKRHRQPVNQYLCNLGREILSITVSFSFKSLSNKRT
ncbi:hypothetical protein Peur_047405 [Populus x canadensis]